MIDWSHIKGKAPEAAPQAVQPAPEPPVQARHTLCRFCGQDIEGFFPYPKGQWRDRGNDTHCPAPLPGYPGHKEGTLYEAQLHSPIGTPRKPKPDVTPTPEDLARYAKAKR